jgi:hypothetical protein
MPDDALQRPDAPGASPEERREGGSVSAADVAAGHELSDVNVRGILWFAAGLVVFAVVVHLVLAWMFRVFAAEEQREKRSRFEIAGEVNPDQLPPTPLEGINPRRGVSEEVGRGTAPKQIDPDAYGWVDPGKGIVQIPVEVAAERALKSGIFKVREQKDGKAAGADQAPSDSNSGRRPWRAGR